MSTKSGSSAKKAVRSKKRQPVKNGQIHIKATFNNTLIIITDAKGNKLTQSSAGACGQKGSRKGTPYAATMACEDALQKAKDIYGFIQAEIHVCGVGSGRESAIRAVRDAGITVTLIVDRTPVPHNGCRPPKERRV